MKLNYFFALLLFLSCNEKTEQKNIKSEESLIISDFFLDPDSILQKGFNHLKKIDSTETQRILETNLPFFGKYLYVPHSEFEKLSENEQKKLIKKLSQVVVIYDYPLPLSKEIFKPILISFKPEGVEFIELGFPILYSRVSVIALNKRKSGISFELADHTYELRITSSTHKKSAKFNLKGEVLLSESKDFYNCIIDLKAKEDPRGFIDSTFNFYVLTPDSLRTLKTINRTYYIIAVQKDTGYHIEYRLRN